VENRDLDQDDVLAEVLDEAGLNGAATVAMTQDPAIKADLRQRTDQVVERGVFGVPAMFVGDQLVWGQDRLHFVETLLEGGIL
jgi:2-hydroxychromene-2-carboxylate isomerase